MPRSPTTGIFTRVDNSFSNPVFGTVIDPTDAIEYYDDIDGGLTFDNASPLILAGQTSGILTIKPAAISGTSAITLPAGTTDFTATGGTGQFVRQDSAGGPFTVSTVPASVISSGQALTRTDDTNVTLTLGGTPTTALLQATSITAGWTGQLSLARGGTNANLTASNGGIFYSTASAGAILAGTATANLPLLSGSSTTPSWATITYPASATSGGVPYFSSTSAMASSAALGSGQIVVGGGAGAAPTTSANASLSSGALTLGQAGTALGSIVLAGNTSGTVTMRPPAAAGSWTFTLPDTDGASGEVLTTDGSGVTSWTAVAGTGTVTSVSAGTGMSFTTITSSGPVNIDKASAANYYAATSNKVVTTDIVYPAEVTVSYGTTTTFDFSTFINAAVTLTGNITTQTFSNITAGKAGMIRFIQDGSGNHTTVWNSNLKFPGGVAPTLSTAAGAVDVLVYQTVSSSYIVASLIRAVA